MSPITHMLSHAALFAMIVAGAACSTDDSSGALPCPAEEPYYGRTDGSDCGDDKTCPYSSGDTDCPLAYVCSNGKWAPEIWPAEGEACEKVGKVCAYRTAADGPGGTMYTYCMPDETIHHDLRDNWGDLCPELPPWDGDPCQVPKNPECTYTNGCETTTALCHSYGEWEVTTTPCP
jgi:hypothetical protein